MIFGTGGAQVISLVPGLRVVQTRAGGVPNGLLNNLVAYWPGNEAGGANDMLDLHTNALHLTQADSPGADTGLSYATARVMAAPNDVFYRASETALQVDSTSAAWAAWIFPTAAQTERFISKDNGSTAREYVVRMDANRKITAFGWFGAGAGTFGIVTTTGTATLNQWNLALCWFDSAAQTLNVSINNASPQSAATGSSRLVAATAQFTVSGISNTRDETFAGRLAQIAMWKGVVLSADQRTALYNAGAGLPYASFTA